MVCAVEGKGLDGPRGRGEPGFEREMDGKVDECAAASVQDVSQNIAMGMGRRHAPSGGVPDAPHRGRGEQQALVRQHKPRPKLENHAPHVVQPIRETAHGLLQQLLAIRAVLEKPVLCIACELVEERVQFAFFGGQIKGWEGRVGGFKTRAFSENALGVWLWDGVE